MINNDNNDDDIKHNQWRAEERVKMRRVVSITAKGKELQKGRGDGKNNKE